MFAHKDSDNSFSSSPTSRYFLVILGLLPGFNWPFCLLWGYYQIDRRNVVQKSAEHWAIGFDIIRYWPTASRWWGIEVTRTSHFEYSYLRCWKCWRCYECTLWSREHCSRRRTSVFTGHWDAGSWFRSTAVGCSCCWFCVKMCKHSSGVCIQQILNICVVPTPMHFRLSSRGIHPVHSAYRMSVEKEPGYGLTRSRLMDSCRETKKGVPGRCFFDFLQIMRFFPLNFNEFEGYKRSNLASLIFLFFKLFHPNAIESLCTKPLKGGCEALDSAASPDIKLIRYNFGKCLC